MWYCIFLIPPIIIFITIFILLILDSKDLYDIKDKKDFILGTSYYFIL